jgi:hypothetical protein
MLDIEHQLQLGHAAAHPHPHFFAPPSKSGKEGGAKKCL